MNKKRTLHPGLMLALTLAAAGVAEAQRTPDEMRGLASGLAVGLSVHPSSRNTATEKTLVKAPLNQASPPPAWSLQLFPYGTNYSLPAMFPTLWDAVEIDGQSTGNDVIPDLDSRGIPMLTQRESWMAVVVSVTNAAVGTGAGPIQWRRSRGSGRTTPGADLISYYLDESVGLATEVIGQNLLEQSSEALGYAGSEDVDALDFGLGVLSHARQTTSTLFFPNRTSFYFSVSKDSAAEINRRTNGRFAKTRAGADVPADGASVYEIAFVGFPPAWTSPIVYRSATDLELDPSIDELDALAVDPDHETTVFSTQFVLGRPQLLVHGQVGAVSRVFTFRNDASESIAIRLGTRDDIDDIDAVCVYDPERDELDTLAGMPVGRIALSPAPPVPMGLSTTRMRALNAMTDRLMIQATGWGGAQPGVGRLHYFVSPNYDAASPWYSATWLDAGTFVRFPGDDVMEHSLSLPSGLPGGRYSVAAVLTDFAGTPLATSLVSQFAVQ